MLLYNSKYETFPIVVHCPGKKTTVLWEKLSKLFKSKGPKYSVCLDDTTIITWNNAEKSCLERSLDVYRVPYFTLGKGIVDWHNPIKLHLTNDALSGIKTKYVIGLDANDVLVLNDPNEIVRRFSEFGCRMLFNCGPIDHPPVSRQFNDLQARLGEGHDFKYLNGGVWVGETDYCREFFRDCSNAREQDEDPTNEWWDISEQFYIKSAFVKHHANVKLDYRAQIFQIVHPMWEGETNIYSYVI